jgi:hypothetical protein
VPADSCENCGSTLPAKSRFCPECGARVGATPGETAVQELPPHETSAAPVDVMLAERRFFGVTPPTGLFALAAAAFVLAVVLLVSGHWIWGLLLVVAAVFLVVTFVAQTKRVPAQASGVAKASVDALEAVKARAEATFETVAAHGSAKLELIRLRRELAELAAERGRWLRQLGEVVYDGDRKATKELKERVGEVDERIQAKEAEMTAVAEQAERRIERAQLEVQATHVVEPEEPPDATPDPDRVPAGPFPPPEEGEPPQPARVPEPFPPPDEGDRPDQPDSGDRGAKGGP